MQTLFALLTLASFLALLVGLVEPSLVMRWGGEEKQTRKQVLLYYGLGFLALLILMPTDGDSEQAQSFDQQTAAEQTEEPSIPDDLNYEIINEDVVPGAKRSLDIRLNRKVPAEVLRLLARQLKDSDSGSYDRTFIVYYLPNMTVNAGGWATSHFKPDLNVKILGVTAEKERALRQGNDEVQGEVIGKWLYEGGVAGSRLVLFREDGNLQMKRTYGDGSSATTEMIEKQSSRGRRIEEKNNDTVDYWLINESGNLERRDDVGLIGTAERIQ